ncbi:MAG: thioredoxin family protein [Bacteroidota bacterium]
MKQFTVKQVISISVLILVTIGAYFYIDHNSSLYAANYKIKTKDKGMSVEEFQKRIANMQKPVLVYFNASWCMPCVKLKPEMDQLEKEVKAYCDVFQVNTDDNPKVTEHYEINSLPMFVLYKNGRKVWENIGSVSKSQLQTKIEGYK